MKTAGAKRRLSGSQYSSFYVKLVNYLIMGLFGPNLGKRVTKEEYKQIMQNIYGKLDAHERSEVEQLFRADLHEDGEEAGISQKEFDAAMDWLKVNKSKHVLEESDIALLEKYFTEHLRD